ncbi:MAG: hypothetical protein WBG71_14445 [Leeuwenhoekiella sp.]
MEDLAAHSQYVELVAALIGLIMYKHYKGTQLVYFLILLWYVTINEFFAGISYPVFGIPNYIPYNIYYGINFVFFLWWYRSLISWKNGKKALLFFMLIFLTGYLVDSMFLNDIVYRYLTYAFTAGTVLLILCVAIYFMDRLYRDAVFNITASPYFWISFGVLFYCVAYLPFLVAYRFMESNYGEIRSVVLFIVNVIQYCCFAVAFIKGRQAKEEYPAVYD